MSSLGLTDPSTTTSCSQGPTSSNGPNQDSSHSLSRLEMLPPELVSEICSYLGPREVSRLGVTCRILDKKSQWSLYKPESTLYSNNSAIIWACMNGNPDTVSILLTYGLNPNPPPAPKARSPLELAAMRMQEPVVRLLLENGADPNSRLGGFTPLVQASSRWGAGCEVARLLLEHGADPNLPDACATALRNAVYRLNLDVTRLLLDHGANPNTPEIDLKLQEGHCERDEGGWGDAAVYPTRVTATPRYRFTPLDNAVSRFSYPLYGARCRHLALEMVRLLLSHGAKVNYAPGNELAYPCHLAVCSSESPEMLRLLLENGADPSITNPKNSSIWTPLHRAMGPDIPAFYTELLLRHGADLTPPGWSLQDPRSTVLGELIETRFAFGGWTYGNERADWEKLRLLMAHAGHEILHKVPRSCFVTFFSFAIRRQTDGWRSMGDAIKDFAATTRTPLAELHELAREPAFLDSVRRSHRKWHPTPEGLVEDILEQLCILEKIGGQFHSSSCSATERTVRTVG